MNNIRFIAMALILSALTSCASASMPEASVSLSPESTASPIPQTHSEEFTEPTRYKSREEFHNAVIGVKETQNRGDAQTSDNVRASDKLEEIMWYFDFTNVVEGVELGEIGVAKTYVALEYWNIETDSESMVIRTWRDGISETAFNTETEWLDKYKQSGGGYITQIDGKMVLKQEVYWQSHNNRYMGNQYYWIVDGYCVFMRVPPWLLELYPEETFFDIQVVTVPTEKSGDAE